MKLAERIYLAQVNASIENRKSKIENRLTSSLNIHPFNLVHCFVAELSASLRCYRGCFVWLEGSCQAGLFASAVVAVEYTFFDSFVNFAVCLRHSLLDFLH